MFVQGQNARRWLENKRGHIRVWDPGGVGTFSQDFIHQRRLLRTRTGTGRWRTSDAVDEMVRNSRVREAGESRMHLADAAKLLPASSK